MKKETIAIGICIILLITVAGYWYRDSVKKSQEISELENKRSTLKNQYDALLDDYNDLKNQYDALLGNNTDLQNKYDTLLENSADLQSQYEALLSNYNDLKKQYESLLENNTDLQDKYDVLPGKYTSPFGMCQVFWCDAVCRNYAVEAKVKWIREDFLWQNIEPTKGNFDFSGYDERVDEVLADGFNIIGICAYNNPWSSGNVAPNTEEHYQDYANYVSALVQRYKGKIMYWEIWNEPDVDHFWRPEPDAINYTNLLKYAYIAAKEVDPSVKILGLGGVDSGNTEYIKTAFQNGALNYMDIIALHPYGDSAIFEISTQYQSLDVIKNLMSNYNSNIPIWVTEVGYPTYNKGINEGRQAELLVRVYISLLSKGVENIFWYNLIDDPDYAPAEDDTVPHFGLFDSNLSPRKSYFSYKNMATLLEGYKVSKEYNIGEDCKAILFEKSTNEQILILWTYGEEIDERGNIIYSYEKNINLKILGNIDDVINIYGQSVQSWEIQNSILTIKIDNSPIYIKGDFDIVEIVTVS